MEYTIFSKNQGGGYISKDEIIDYRFKKIVVSFEFGTIQPLIETNLGGFFCRKLTYLGCDNKELLFHIGTEKNLFETTVYYQSVYKISDTRIFLMYSNIAGRDYNFINGIWK